MTSAQSVLFDRGPLGSGSLFCAAERIIEAWEPDDVAGALAAMEAAQASGKWLAGYASYELGYALAPSLAQHMPSQCKEPLLRFGVFQAVVPPEPAAFTGAASLEAFEPLWSFDDYAAAFQVVRANLLSGDIYQANLTFPLFSRFSGALPDLYAMLKQRQPVPHGAYVDLGDTKLLSRSPELFFSLTAEGALRTRPMKGTIRRGATEQEDAQLKAQLAASEKNRAENLMITDLLRNDFGRIAQIGTVRVPKLFEIESYSTVHQMISEVTAQLVSGTRLTDILSAVFPCGSITGAPKIRAMEILSGLEAGPRGPYCGAIGWIAPTGAMEFSVAIRTLICEPSGRVTLNVGGGVVYDSTAQGEYDEALLKARFAQNLG
jgi:para-aminobenzoate synthetase component I